MLNYHPDTIVAITTPFGRGGVGIIRISGPDTKKIAKKMLGKIPQPRYADYLPFKSHEKEIIDRGIALFFPQPRSYTGEDVLELHGHGGPVVMDRLVQCILQIGARLAKPGEFTERAFLNDKVDLVQAEAVIDLIEASSQQAARSAIRSLQGEFSRQVHRIVKTLIDLRIQVEAAIDFPEEEIDFLTEGKVKENLQKIIDQVRYLLHSANQGALLREGMTVVIVGKPNAGKSSLLNCLSGNETAIVTEIAGTTRDILRESINIDGLPIHVVDTAGLRESNDIIEKEGIRRTWQEIEKADLVLLIVDSTQKKEVDKYIEDEIFYKLSKQLPYVVIKNKIDLTNEKPMKTLTNGKNEILISAKYNQGIELLKEHLKVFIGFSENETGVFLARRRHIDALIRAKRYLENGFQQLCKRKSNELLAEDLRCAQQALSEITGEFTADDLLGEIFSKFCIGK